MKTTAALTLRAGVPVVTAAGSAGPQSCQLHPQIQGHSSLSVSIACNSASKYMRLLKPPQTPVPQTPQRTQKQEAVPSSPHTSLPP